MSETNFDDFSHIIPFGVDSSITGWLGDMFDHPDEVHSNSDDAKLCTSLYIDGPITDVSLAKLAKLPNLTILHLSNAAVTGEGLGLFTKLTSLHLDDCKHVTKMVPVAASCKLKVLHLYGFSTTDMGVALTILGKNLKDLAICYTDYIGVSSCGFPQALSTLDLTGTSATNDYLFFILLNNASINYLIANNCYNLNLPDPDLADLPGHYTVTASD